METTSANQSLQTEATSPMERTWPEVLMTIIPPIIVILGTIGNGLTLAVMLRPKYRKLSTSVYLMALTVVDTLYLYVSRLTIHGWEDTTGRNMFVDSQWSCKILEGLGFISTSCSAWFIVGVTLERVVAVAMPHKAKALCTRKRAWQAVVMVTVGFSLLYIVVFVMYGVRPNPMAMSGFECYMKEEFGRLSILLVFLMYLIFYSFLPFCILIVANVIIVFKLIQYQRQRSTVMGGAATDSADSDTKRLTVMLVVISCYFLLATLPLRLFWATHSIAQYLEAPVDSSKYSFAAIVLSLRTLANSNHAVNFLLYCVSGGPFRQELVRMFRCADSDNVGSGVINSRTKESEVSKNRY